MTVYWRDKGIFGSESTFGRVNQLIDDDIAALNIGRRLRLGDKRVRREGQEGGARHSKKAVKKRRNKGAPTPD
jgi:hypothetical protein